VRLGHSQHGERLFGVRCLEDPIAFFGQDAVRGPAHQISRSTTRTLAEAHVGIAMGTGTDVAIESAGVTLVKGDLRGVAKVRRLSQSTMRNIRQNLSWAFAYNTLGVPIAAGVLYPTFGLLLSPIIASATMTFSSVSVIGNALRLRRAAL